MTQGRSESELAVHEQVVRRLANGTDRQLVLRDAELTAHVVTPRHTALDLEAMPDPAFLVGGDGRIEAANTLAAALVGYTIEELIGHPLELVLTAGEGQTTLGVRYVPSAQGACIHHRSGRDLPIALLLCPHIDDLTVAIVRLSPEEQEGRLYEEDVAQIVHDLKSPLSTIALETAVLEYRLPVQGDSETRGALRRIANNLTFVDRMVLDLLDLCAIDTGRFEIRRFPTELCTLLEDVVERCVATRDRSRVVLETGAPTIAMVDDLRIQRVVANLVNNALKYAPAASQIVVRLEPRAGEACISVIDAGPGLSAEEVAFVFHKYRRARTALGCEGSGLGLFVSRKIVEAHGGRIGVHAIPGKGSRFFFELPLSNG